MTALPAADELAIRNLLARYGDAVCRRDADAWIDTWAEDCVWDLGRGRVTRGHAETLALWRTSIAKYPWVAQLPASGTVSLVDGRARGEWYVLELNHVLDGSGVMHLGYYRDVYTHTGGQWRFAERRFQLVYRGAMDAGEVRPHPTGVHGMAEQNDPERNDVERDSADRNYEDVTKYGLTSESETELLAHQAECTFIWSNREGHPVGVVMNYVFSDGRFWLTASGQRARVPAVRRDPRVSIVISSLGSGITTRQSLTYKGRCVVHEDETIKNWFYPALAAAVRPGDPDAQAAFVRHLDSPRRVVLEVVPEARIGFDSTQMWRDTPDAARRE